MSQEEPAPSDLPLPPTQLSFDMLMAQDVPAFDRDAAPSGPTWTEDHLGYETGSKAIVAEELAALAGITEPELRKFALGNIYTSIAHSNTYEHLAKFKI